ncbi:hypothetical protein BGM26_06035 [Bacillus sp. FJAT-29790]|uniref:hypothetical protein n=1 Tax=Bacillus sp. FJAT-29790 TaxID=1895002 RepID=UPI001C240066|nr:hypothetical protein [Bacillus sp. FJAT-29790]MBU8878548.1 hypothetical protein [Bacillus sp. FJAT-29790]
MKMNFTAISVIFLSLSVLISSVIISNSLKNTTNDDSQILIEKATKEVMENPLLTKEEMAEYLGISEIEFDEIDRNQIHTVGRGIPYIESDSNKYYTIIGLSEWLADTDLYRSNSLEDYK